MVGRRMRDSATLCLTGEIEVEVVVSLGLLWTLNMVELSFGGEGLYPRA